MQQGGVQFLASMFLHWMLSVGAVKAGLRRSAPASVPVAGELIGRVGDKLAVEHTSLASAAEQLLGVQGEVDATEKSLLGKVLDLQTARNLYAQHLQVDVANSKARNDVVTLNDQVDGLNMQLSKAQAQMVSDGDQQRTAENTLHITAEEKEATIKGLTTELDKYKDSLQKLMVLQALHQQLLAQGAMAVQQGTFTNQGLQGVIHVNAAETIREELLKKTIKETHEYSLMCRIMVQKLEAKLHASMKVEPAERMAVKTAVDEAMMVTRAGEQRLLAEQALLKAEISKAETEGVQAISRLTALKKDFNQLQVSIVASVDQTKGKIFQTQQHMALNNISTEENVGAETADDTLKRQIDQQLQDLNSQLAPEQSYILEAENEALQIELEKSAMLLTQLKVAEGRANADQQQNEADEAAQENAAKIAEANLVAAREEGQKRLTAEVKKAAANMEKYKADMAAAKSAIQAKCAKSWESYAKELKVKTDACDSVKDELTAVQAQQNTLMEALKAQQA